MTVKDIALNRRHRICSDTAYLKLAVLLSYTQDSVSAIEMYLEKGIRIGGLSVEPN